MSASDVVQCPECEGSGWVCCQPIDTENPDMRVCTVCRGSVSCDRRDAEALVFAWWAAGFFDEASS